MSNARRITPVILSGGAGMRLWPLSRQDRPKQFLVLDGGRSLIQQTALRVGDAAAFDPPIVVAGEAQGAEVEAQLAAAGVVPGLLILEPSARNTAPAIALAALAAETPEALLLVLPSDHFIADPDGFRAEVAAARGAAQDGWLVTFGIAADRAETGYGYILAGKPIGGGVSRVAAFVEKPDCEAAEAYLHEGRLWNSGIFLMRADSFLDALARHATAIARATAAAVAGAQREGRRLLPDADAFAQAPAVAVDRAVMEKHDQVAVRPARFGWSDIGSWEAVRAVAPRDESGNAVAGDALAIGCRDSLIRSDGPAVVAIGVTDLVLVATERAVLAVPRGESQRVPEAVAALAGRGDASPRPREVLETWVERFNAGDAAGLAALYHEDAVNHQVTRPPVVGRDSIRAMFEDEFARADMVCLVEAIHEAGEVAALEWRDPNGLRGCGFFTVRAGLIAFQRGYWDKLAFLRLYGLPLE